jgi:hypothetical protein
VQKDEKFKRTTDTAVISDSAIVYNLRGGAPDIRQPELAVG